MGVFNRKFQYQKKKEIMNQEELEAKIDAFLWEILPDADKKLIEKEININPDFRAKVAVRQFEHRLLERMERESLAAKMTLWEAEAAVSEKKMPIVVVETPPMTVVYRRPWYKRSALRWAVAASMALVVSIGYYWAKTRYDSEVVAQALEKNKEAFNLPEPQITEDTKTGGPSTLSKEDYDETIAKYTDFLKNTEGSVETRQKAEWQLILIYMEAHKTAENPEFTRLLATIANNPNHIFYNDARQLNDKTKTFWWRWVN
jgi:hypothetical protein